MKEMTYIGARVEMKDGSIQGTITSIPAPNFWSILWDDGESGAVHPLDVKLLVQERGMTETMFINPETD